MLTVFWTRFSRAHQLSHENARSSDNEGLPAFDQAKCRPFHTVMANKVSVARIRLLVEPDDQNLSATKEYVLQLHPSDLQADEAVRQCAQHLNIDPIRRHLFGLYNNKLDLWLAPNCVLAQLAQQSNALDNLEFRLRFLPYAINSLKIEVSKPTRRPFRPSLICAFR